jgi:hypothetical protein
LFKIFLRDELLFRNFGILKKGKKLNIYFLVIFLQNRIFQNK